MNKETGEIATYSEACKDFYSTPRGYLDSIFDEWIETDLQSDEPIPLPDFSNVIAKH